MKKLATKIPEEPSYLLLYYGLSHFADGTDLKHLLSKYRVFDALIDKGPEYIWHRVPEISYYEADPPHDRQSGHA
jgi:hypothetical protein